MKSLIHDAKSRGHVAALIPATEGYRLWSQSYDTNPNPLLALEMRELSPRLGRLRNRVFLDIACGTGRWMQYAAAKGARAFGADLVHEMLAIACRKPHIVGRLVQAHACRLPFAAGCADVVVCSFALGYIGDLRDMVEELRRVTRQGGRIFASDMHPRARNSGWRRTFHCGFNLFEIESYPHSSEHLIQAGSRTGLRLREVLQPCFGAPELEIMRRAGKVDQIEAVQEVPAIMVLEWERT